MKTMPSSGVNFDRAMVLLCCLASLLPILLFPYFPSQDGGAHAYSAWALHELQAGSAFFQQYFRETTPLTNWAATVILKGLQYVLPARGLERGFALVYVALMIGAAMVTTRSLLRLPLGFAVVFFPLIFSHMLHMGSFNMALGDAAFLLFVGATYRYAVSPSGKGAALVGALLLLIFTLHAQVVLMALLLTAIAVLWLGWQALCHRQGFYKLRDAIWLILASLPANAMCLVFALQSRGMENYPYYAKPNEKFLHLLKLSGIASYSLFGIIVNITLFVVLVFTTGFIAIRRTTADKRPATGCLLAGAVGLLLFFLIVPNGFDDANNAEERVMIPLLCVFLAWLALRLQAFSASHIVALVGALFVVLQSVDRLHAFAGLNTVLAEFSEVSAAIPDGSAVVLVELDEIGSYHLHRTIRHPLSVVTRFDPERNFLGNVLSGRQVIFASDYEAAANKPYFAMKYQPWLAPIIADRSMDLIAEDEAGRGAFTSFAGQLRQAPQPVKYLALWCGHPENYQDAHLEPFLAALQGNYHEVFSSSAAHMRLFELD